MYNITVVEVEKGEGNTYGNVSCGALYCGNICRKACSSDYE